MKIAVIGAGAMGSVIGGRLAQGGNDVTLIDVWPDIIRAINTRGLRIEDQHGKIDTIPIRATANPAEVGVVDLMVVFVKCYHTEAAVRNALPIVGPQTTVLSLQNGWGNGTRISNVVGPERVLLGVCYHSASSVSPGHVQHAGQGMTFIGERNGSLSERVQQIVYAFQRSYLEVTASPEILKEIWSKLALNACTLPTSAVLRFYAPQLVQSEPARNLMKGILDEVVAVANMQSIPLDFHERWESISNLLKRCPPTAKSSMFEDIEAGRRTEIDVINGAVVETAAQLGIATPCNQSIVQLIQALESTFKPKLTP